MNDLKFIADEMRNCARLAHGTPCTVRITATTLNDWAAVLDLAAARQATPFRQPIHIASARGRDRPVQPIAPQPARAVRLEGHPVSGQAPQIDRGAPFGRHSVHSGPPAYADPPATAGLPWWQREANGALVVATLCLFCGAVILLAVAFTR